MTRLAVIATITVTPGSRETYLEQLMEHRRRSLENEPGTLMFEVLLPHDEPDEIMLYEVYADEASFDAHRSGESMAEIARNTKGLLTSLTGVPCTPLE